jgi:hypothetical protein
VYVCGNIYWTFCLLIKLLPSFILVLEVQSVAHGSQMDNDDGNTPQEGSAMFDTMSSDVEVLTLPEETAASCTNHVSLESQSANSQVTRIANVHAAIGSLNPLPITSNISLPELTRLSDQHQISTQKPTIIRPLTSREFDCDIYFCVLKFEITPFLEVEVEFCT